MSEEEITQAPDFSSVEGRGETSETLPQTTTEDPTERQTEDITLTSDAEGYPDLLSYQNENGPLSDANEGTEEEETFQQQVFDFPELYDEEEWEEGELADEDAEGYFDMEELFEYEDEEEGLGDLRGNEEDEDTIPVSAQEVKIVKKSASPEEKKSKRNKNDVTEMSQASFRWFERRILSRQIPKSDENLRRTRLLEKCRVIRKVSKPVVTILGVTKVFPQKEFGDAGRVKSTQSLGDDTVNKTFPDYSDREWAMKNTVDFLTNAGCSSSSGQTYVSTLRAVRNNADFRLSLYERQLKKRRKAIGNQLQAPEITAAMRRHAERAVWRAVIDNTKPRYPLPRFILPRHRYLRKVQADFIGPGSYEHNVYDKQVKIRQMSMPSTWATCSSRFAKDPNEVDPNDMRRGGNGTCHLLDPWESLDKANLKHRHPGTCIPFESTPQNWRKMTEPGSRIPSNAYNIKSPLEEFVKSKTSLRGPYDCYTPSRGVIPYGYYKSAKDEEAVRLGPGSYEIRTSLVSKMNDPYNSFKGILSKADRDKMFGFKAAFDKPLWPKELGIPPVGLYEIGNGDIGRDKEQNLAPFKVQSGLRKKDSTRDLVAPDYYYFGSSTWSVDPKGADLASVFHSKAPQLMPSKLHSVQKERNRAMNRYCDIEGGLAKHEEHYAFDVPMKNTYVLEDCKDPCYKSGGGPRLDPYAIPGHGLDSVLATGKCCGC